MISYNDFAIALAWPDKTAYGDEKWMALLKKCGIVKNLNFKVGHAAILLVSYATGAIDYYDFGRYVSPRGNGRARSKEFDTRLHMQTVAEFSNRKISNIDAIMNELSNMEQATHGGGRLLFSIVPNISQIAAAQLAQLQVRKGPIPYGAFAAGNNSCSRFVAQVLIAGMPPKDPRINRLKYPETIALSPVSNITNTHDDGFIHCCEDGEVKKWKMNRLRSLQFHWQLLKENLSKKQAYILGCDTDNGQIEQPRVRPENLQEDAQWLGGIGEGMWFQINLIDLQRSHYIIESYTRSGVLINQVWTVCAQNTFDIQKPFDITMQMDGCHFMVLQQGTKYLFKKTENIQYRTSYQVI